MTAQPWKDPAWLLQHTADLSMENAWRGVETQYVAATMKLVDGNDEQGLLEELLENSKPPTPQADRELHYVLLSPFRYVPPHSSRFRPGGQSGLWYGSSTLEGACSEIAYWRMRFLLDSAGVVNDEVVTDLTFFQASVRGRAINLMSEPWTEFAPLWKHHADYTSTHELASIALATEQVDWIQYESVRAPQCALAAALTPDALHADTSQIERSTQEWVCKTTRDLVQMIQKGGPGRFEWRE